MKKLIFLFSLSALSAFAFDADSYVQTGLIAQWDGIDRAPEPAERDADNAFPWTARVGGYDFTLKNDIDDVGNGFYFHGTTSKKDTWGELSSEGTAALFPTATKNDYTLELVVMYPAQMGQGVTFRGPAAAGPSFGPNSLDAATQTTQFAMTGGSNTSYPLVLACDDYVAKTNTYTLTYRSNAAESAFLNGVECPLDTSATKIALNSGCSTTILGAKPGGSLPTKQTIYAIRVYNRVLEPAEIAQNALVDDERFRGISSMTYTVGATLDDVEDTSVTVTPDYGIHTTSMGEQVAFSVADSMADYEDGVRAASIGEGHRAYYAGMSVRDDGTEIARKTEEAFSWTIASAKMTFVWQFTNEQIRVVTSVQGDGRVSGGGWTKKGGTTTLVATPDADCEFVKWTGDVTGIADVTASTVSFTLDAPRALTAVFRVNLYPGETYPDDYALIKTGWKGQVTKPGSTEKSAETSVDARFRLFGTYEVGNFDPDQLPGFLLLLK